MLIQKIVPSTFNDTRIYDNPYLSRHIIAYVAENGLLIQSKNYSDIETFFSLKQRISDPLFLAIIHFSYTLGTKRGHKWMQHQEHKAMDHRFNDDAKHSSISHNY